MVVYFANRAMDILGLASTELTEGFHISDDDKFEDTDTGVTQFECTIHWTEESRELCKACAEAGNYLLRSHEGEHEFYTIIESEEDTKDRTIYIYAEDAGMDLLNEQVGAFAADSAHPAAWYINHFAEDSGFEIGVNEISSLSRKLEWTGEATVAERIASVATQFDNAEVSYSFEISGLVVTHKYINIYAERGKDAGVTLRLNREVDRIITTTSVADLATALFVTGGTKEGEEDPVTLEGYVATDSGGDIYTNGDGYVRSKSALAVWSRYVNPNETGSGTGDIVHQWSYDTTSQSELFNRSVTQLEKVNHPAVNYEIEITNMPENVAVGDYVYIVDEGAGLYLQSRILQRQTSVCNETVTLTLGEYKIDSGGLSSQVSALSSTVNTISSCIVATDNGGVTIKTSGDGSYVYIDGALVLKKNCAVEASSLNTPNSGTLSIGVGDSAIQIGASSNSLEMWGDPIYIDGAGTYPNGKIYIGTSGATEIQIGHYSNVSAYQATTRIRGNTIHIGDTGGDVYIKGQAYSSDERLKTSIQPLESSGLDNLTPVSFQWKSGDNRTHYGYVAQQVREHIPEIVKENDDGLLSLAYTEIIPLLHCKINQMESTIESLEARIEKLEAIFNENT